MMLVTEMPTELCEDVLDGVDPATLTAWDLPAYPAVPLGARGMAADGGW